MKSSPPASGKRASGAGEGARGLATASMISEHGCQRGTSSLSDCCGGCHLMNGPGTVGLGEGNAFGDSGGLVGLVVAMTASQVGG